MKKIIYFISVLLTCTCLGRSARAFWPDLTPLIPFSPQFCVMCIPPAIGWAYDSIDQVKEVKRRLEEMTDVTKIKQKLTSYAVSLGNQALNFAAQKLSAKKKVASASRTIMESKREGVNIHKEEDIRVDFVKLFLQYPSDNTKMKSVYKQKSEDLKTDMALEMYITASEMYKELCGENGKGCEIAYKVASDPDFDVSAALASSDAAKGKKGKKGKKVQEDTPVMKEDMQRKRGRLLMITMMESCLMEGKYCDDIGVAGCVPSKYEGSGDTNTDTSKTPEQPTEGQSGSEDEDKVCHWKAALDVAIIYDQIMRDNEYLVQLQNQYRAVMSISNLAQIKDFKSDEEKALEESKNIKTNLDKSGIGKDLSKSMCQQCMAKNGGAEKCLSVCSN